jgi:hypothetical protein
VGASTRCGPVNATNNFLRYHSVISAMSVIDSYQMYFDVLTPLPHLNFFFTLCHSVGHSQQRPFLRGSEGAGFKS